jgi:epoxyqueuosine reductase QueG
MSLAESLREVVLRLVREAQTETRYREPLVGFAAADDARFAELPQVVQPGHMLPSELLPGARSVLSFFLPFSADVVEANARDRDQVAREWAVGYVETNGLIGHITSEVSAWLAQQGISSAAEPATHNFDPVTLVSRWSHKSVAVIAGLGAIGLHQMVITDAGCAGRFGSLVMDAEFGGAPAAGRERCAYLHDGTCLECVQRCPVNALDISAALDKQACWSRLQSVMAGFADIGVADVCGKCAVGPCALESAVEY